MDERAEQRHMFVAGHGFDGWTATAIAGDASSRRYWRLTLDGHSLIFMDAEPGPEFDRFVSVDRWLRSLGLAAPEILALDAIQGFMICEDLGRDTLVTLNGGPDDWHAVDAVVDVLVRLDAAKPPDDSWIKMSPAIGGEMVRLTAQHYAATPELADDLAQLTTDALEKHANTADRPALRDFHAGNLIWRPKLQWSDRIGLIDFQDAFVAPAGYDLVSFLRDARRQPDPTQFEQAFTRFCDTAGKDKKLFRLQAAVLSIQRNLRILGIFARLTREGGKPRYADFLPTTWAQLMADLELSELSDQRKTLLALLPDPETAMARWNATA